jgi:hypothetical protein
VALCVYELRDGGGSVVATGRLTLELPPAEGDELRVGRRQVRVETVTPTGGGEFHLVLSVVP